MVEKILHAIRFAQRLGANRTEFSDDEVAGLHGVVAELDRLKAENERLGRERDEWADALRTVAPGCVSSPVAANTAIRELKDGWDKATARSLQLEAKLVRLRPVVEAANVWSAHICQGNNMVDFRMCKACFDRLLDALDALEMAECGMPHRRQHSDGG